MSSRLAPEDIIDRLKLCLTRQKLMADVDAALRDAIGEIERLRAQLDQARQHPAKVKKPAKRDKGKVNR
jgi:hypothetical protein